MLGIVLERFLVFVQRNNPIPNETDSFDSLDAWGGWGGGNVFLFSFLNGFL